MSISQNIRHPQVQHNVTKWLIILKCFKKHYSICILYHLHTVIPITLVNTQNVSVTKTVDSSSIQHAETKYGIKVQFLALVVMIREVWLNA